MKNVGLYVRVSTQEQKNHGLSVDSQIDALKEYCDKQGYTIYSVYNDAGISGRKKYKSRPALLQLLDDCKNGEIDLILFTKLDRWFRSVADYYEVQSILDETKVPWRAIWEDYETETSSGIFKVNIMLSIAQAESDRTSERIRAVNAYRRAKGEYIGCAPRGYKVVNKNLVVDEELKPTIQLFFDTYLSTLSPSRALDAVNDTLHIDRRSARRMLLNKTYAGDADGYKCYEYITPAQHDYICRVFATRRERKAPKNRHTYIFSGLLRCGRCGKAMTGLTKHTRLYQCVNHYSKGNCDYGSYTREDAIENYLLEELENLIGEINVHTKSKAKSNVDPEKKIKSLQQRLERIGLRFELGDIDREEYLTKRSELQNEINKLKHIEVYEPIKLPNNWKEVYGLLDADHKKAYWNSIIKSITVYGYRNDKRFAIEFV